MQLRKIILRIRKWIRWLWGSTRVCSGKTRSSRPGTETENNNLETHDNQDSSSQGAPASLEHSEETAPYVSENILIESEQPPVQPAEAHQSTLGSNPDVDDTSRPNTSNLPSDSLREADKSFDSNTPNENPALTEKKKPKSKAPRPIAGRRGQSTSTSRPRTGRPPVSRPVLICRKPPGILQWEIVLFADNECQIKEVRHNGESLESSNGEYRLSSFAGQLTIVSEIGEPDTFALFDDKPLIFKLRNNWNGNGHNVRRLANGHFIVIAPNNWERLGHVPVEPQSCTDSNFMAHYFFRNERELEEDQKGFRECSIESSSSCFELIGEEVFDDSADGQLFVGAVPKMRVQQGIVWARVGEEKNNGWKGENFKLAERTLTEALDNRQGRFFIRVYDAEVKLLDSGEFRYLRDLKDICIDGERYTAQKLLAPLSSGHPPTKVSFIGANGAIVRPILSSKTTQVKILGNALIAEPHPSGDAISCSLKSNSGSVDVMLNLPRIWWRMERNGGVFDEWQDTPLAMTRQEFRERADTNEVVRLRLPQRIKSVHVGFDDELERVYHHENKENGCLLPLADFVDYSQIDQRLKEDASFHIECSGAVLMLIRISADPVPMIVSFTYEPETIQAGEQVTLHWRTQNVEDDGVSIEPDIGVVESSGSLEVAPLKTTIYMLKLAASGMDDVIKTVTVSVNSLPQAGQKPFACVKRTSGGWRRGKGFSCGELQAAGVTKDHALLGSIPFDKHRRSTHSVNVEMLGRLIDV